MKIFLAGICLFSICLSAHAQNETRLQAIHKFGNPVSWSEQDEHLPGINPGVPRGGSLLIANPAWIESVHPYDFDGGKAFARPGDLLDDLVYESLMLPDPAGRSGHLYPLIARAIRVPSDWSYVVFELDPRARFQDGSPVTGHDVAYSVQVFKNSKPEWRSRFDAVVRDVMISTSEVRLNLSTTDQASRDAIFWLAKVKIIKTNTTSSPVVGGISVRFAATGPYRLTQLGRSRISLIIDPSYWAAKLNTRVGFFNFRSIDRVVQQSDGLNFFEAAGKPGYRPHPQMQIVEEEGMKTGQPFEAYTFNLARPQLADARVREALLLAYDFDRVNQMFHGSELKRPASLLETSELAPRGMATGRIAEWMQSCAPLESARPFEVSGQNSYAQYSDRRARLLNARRLLTEAGMRLENGGLKRQSEDGQWVPVKLNVLARPGGIRELGIYRDDLAHLGIEMNFVVAPNPQALGVLSRDQGFDLIPTEEGFLNSEGWPQPDELNLAEPPARPACLKQIAQSLREVPIYADAYREHAEALARAQQALFLNIFTGQKAKRTYYVENRLAVPGQLPISRIHMYGFWQETESEESLPNRWLQMWQHNFSGCADWSCLFGMSR